MFSGRSARSTCLSYMPSKRADGTVRLVELPDDVEPGAAIA